jgi:GGDEF domain-containing protein
MSLLFIIFAFAIAILIGIVALGLGILIGIRMAALRHPPTIVGESDCHDQGPQQRSFAKGEQHEDASPKPSTSERSSNLSASAQSDSEPSQVNADPLVAKLQAQKDQLQARLSEAEHRLGTQAQQIRDYLTEARTDQLTGLLNRRAIEKLAEYAIMRESGEQNPLALALVDVDHFKSINDRFGHAAGDATLKYVADLLQQSVECSDSADGFGSVEALGSIEPLGSIEALGSIEPLGSVGRFGGEEFLILFQLSLSDALSRLEAVRKLVAGQVLRWDQHQITVTISIGVCGITENQNLAASMRRADQALYRAKRDGRNCIFLHDGLTTHRK